MTKSIHLNLESFVYGFESGYSLLLSVIRKLVIGAYLEFVIW